MISETGYGSGVILGKGNEGGVIPKTGNSTGSIHCRVQLYYQV